MTLQDVTHLTDIADTDALSTTADATFMLAVLAATGIASPHVTMNDTWAVGALHAAAQGGSEEAQLALAHRYFMGDGVPANCREGLRSDSLSFILLGMLLAFCVVASPTFAEDCHHSLGMLEQTIH